MLNVTEIEIKLKRLEMYINMYNKAKVISKENFYFFYEYKDKYSLKSYKKHQKIMNRLEKSIINQTKTLCE
jgi:hypothetical protein